MRWQVHADDADDRYDQHRERDRRAADTGEEVELRIGVESKQRHDVARGKDHVDRCHREPAEPVRPAGESAEPVRAALANSRGEGFLGIGRNATVAVWPHDGHFRQAQTKDQTKKGVESDPEDCRRPHALNGEGGDTGHKNGAGQSDDECAPPVGGLCQARGFCCETFRGHCASIVAVTNAQRACVPKLEPSLACVNDFGDSFFMCLVSSCEHIHEIV